MFWNDIKEVIECYDKALELDPTYTVVYNNKIIVLDHLERNEEAI